MGGGEASASTALYVHYSFHASIEHQWCNASTQLDFTENMLEMEIGVTES